MILLAWEGHNKDAGLFASIAVKRGDGSILWRSEDVNPKLVVGGRVLGHIRGTFQPAMLDAATGKPMNVTGLPAGTLGEWTQKTPTHALLFARTDGQSHVVGLAEGANVRTLPSASQVQLGTGHQTDLLISWRERDFYTWSPGEESPRPLPNLVIPTSLRDGVVWGWSSGSIGGADPMDRDGRRLGDSLPGRMAIWSDTYAVLTPGSKNKAMLVKFT